MGKMEVVKLEHLDEQTLQDVIDLDSNSDSGE